ncbi:hypothetical protein GGH99_003709 [Coemansia sp. RSA 1285]|nr:hypothetical protein GGH99_003709 [Coemansia sp. RSA 1285]
MYACLLGRFNRTAFSSAFGTTAARSLLHTSGACKFNRPLFSDLDNLGSPSSWGYPKRKSKARLPDWLDAHGEEGEGEEPSQQQQQQQQQMQQQRGAGYFRIHDPKDTEYGYKGKRYEPDPLEMDKRREKQMMYEEIQTLKTKARVEAVIKRTSKRRKLMAAEAMSKAGADKDRALRDEEINTPMIALVTESGVMSGVHPLSQVLGTMDRSLYTLVMVDSSRDPPTCRVFSRKILYERERSTKKQQSTASKNAKPQRIVMGSEIDSHDLEIKMCKITDMLTRGRRVIIVVERKGRRRGSDMRKEIAEKIMTRFEPKFSIVSPPSVEGNSWMVMFQGKAQ